MIIIFNVALIGQDKGVHLLHKGGAGFFKVIVILSFM